MFKLTRQRRRFLAIALAAMVLALYGTVLRAQDTSPPAEEPPAEEVMAEPVAATMDDLQTVKISIDTSWVLLTGFLVFFMQTGFALLEAGLVQQKGVVNALLENFVDAGLTAIIFWAVGFAVAFGVDSGGIIGTSNFFLSDAISITDGAITYKSIAEANADLAGYANLSVFTFFFFQFAFAATASTITTGAMAERTDYIGDLIYTGLMAAFTYPIIVHWVWGGGWLADASFHDFAGSTVVHTVGGITALVGAWLLGPRANRKFGELPPAHNLAYATLGTMILWFGWYGFNPGSTLGMGLTGHDGLIGLVIINTTLGAGAGMLACMFLVYARTGKWDLTFTLNGSLAGLVGITAGCAFVMPAAAIVIGAVAGVVVYFAVNFIESIKIDDPVGAFGVHGACGIWGTLAIGIFGEPGLMFGYYAGKGGLLAGGGIEALATQAIGSISVIAATAVMAAVMFGALKAVNRLRVNSAADKIGIDVYEHGASLWPDVLPVPNVTVIDTAPAGAGD